MGHTRSQKNTAFLFSVAISHTYFISPRILSRVPGPPAVHIWICHTYLNNTPTKAEYIYLKVTGPSWTLCWAKDGWQKRTYVYYMQYRSQQVTLNYMELLVGVTRAPWDPDHPDIPGWGWKIPLYFTELSIQSKTREKVLGKYCLNA